MITTKTRIYPAVIGLAALIAMPVLARTVHLHAPAAPSRISTTAGKVTGVQPFQNKADQLRRGVVCEADGIGGTNCLTLPN
jgi:hypothetical protein